MRLALLNSLAFLGCYCLLVTPLAAQDASAVDSRSSATASGNSFSIRYARAYLKYVEATLGLAESKNRRVPQTIPAARVDRMREEVEVARKLLTVAESDSPGDDFPVFVRLAEAVHNVAQDQLNRAMEIHGRVPTPDSQLELERLRLRKELTLITLEHGQSLVGASRDEQTRWKINLLYNPVLRLSEQVSELNQRRGR